MGAVVCAVVGAAVDVIVMVCFLRCNTKLWMILDRSSPCQTSQPGGGAFLRVCSTGFCRCIASCAVAKAGQRACVTAVSAIYPGWAQRAGYARRNCPVLAYVVLVSVEPLPLMKPLPCFGMVPRLIG